MRVHHLNCATLCPAAGRLVGSEAGLFDRGTLVGHCLLVETDADGLVLIDSGFGTADCADPSRFRTGFKWIAKPMFDRTEAAITQVERLGFAPTDVRHVVVTHLDLDHAGGIADFPHAVVHVHAAEHEAATTLPTIHERMRYVPAQWAHDPNWQTYSDAGDELFGLAAVRRLEGLSADIGLVPMLGHSRGHSAVAVDTGDGWLLHAGDAYFHRDEVHAETPDCPFGLVLFQKLVAFDEKARVENQGRLRELHRSRDDLEIFSAHDPVELARYHV